MPIPKFNEDAELLEMLIEEADLVLTARHLQSLHIEQGVRYKDISRAMEIRDEESVRRYARAEVAAMPARRILLANKRRLNWIGPVVLEQVAYTAYRLLPRSQTPKPWVAWLAGGTGEDLPGLPEDFLKVLAYVVFWWHESHYRARGCSEEEDLAMMETVRATLQALPVCGKDASARFHTYDQILDAVEWVYQELEPH